MADAFAEADDAREGVDDAEAAARRPGEQQAAIVGAEIEGAVDAFGARVAILARGPRGSLGAAAVMFDRSEMGIDGGGEIAAAGLGTRRFGGAALVGIALHSSSSSAWHLAFRENPRRAASSGVFWMTLAASLAAIGSGKAGVGAEGLSPRPRS